MKVFIPFKEEFEEPMLNGTKTWTTRNKIYGKKGDVFERFGATFEIDEIKHLSLSEISENFEKEGCKSKEDFIRVWNEIHPLKGFIPTQSCYVHVFHRIGV